MGKHILAQASALIAKAIAQGLLAPKYASTKQMDTSPLVLCKVGTLEVERYKTYLIYHEAKGTSCLLLVHYPKRGGQLSN